ncbi:MAG: sialidase family protein, partial [Gemmatimonadaceae bacterium]
MLADSVDHIDALAREPMVVRHLSGALFVTGYWDSPPPVWKSVDRGATWSRVAVGGSADGAAGNSDSDLAAGPDGTLYLITLVFDRTALTGASIHVAVSHDVGATWKWTQLSHTRGDDRPWIEVAGDGTVHAIWNDGAGVRHALSADSGRTWNEQVRVYTKGGSSHLAIAPNGDVAVRIIPPSAANNQYHAGVDLVAVSTDRGSSWTHNRGPGEMQFPLMWDTTVTPRRFALPAQPHWVEPLAWDSTGALFSL